MSARRHLEDIAAIGSVDARTVLSGAAARGTLRALLRTEEAEGHLRSALADLPAVQLEVLRGSLREQVAAITARPRPSLLLVDIDLADSAQLLALRKLVHSDAAGTPVIVTAPSAGTEELRQLMRLQIADYVPQPMVRTDVVAAVESALRKLQMPKEQLRHHCKVISVVRRAGGMGATFLAIQMALELAGVGRKQTTRRVCLVDLDFHSSDTATYLDVDARLDIAEIARAPQRLDAHLLQSMVTHHPSGVDLLAPPSGLVDLENITPEAVARLLDSVCEQYDFAIVDLPLASTRWSTDVMAGSDAVLVVTRLAVAAVRQAKALLGRLRAEGVPQEAISIVVNCHRRGLFSRGVKLATAEEAFGAKVDFTILEDRKLVPMALDHAQTLQEARPGSRIERQIRDMVRHLVMRLEPDLTVTGKAPSRRSAGKK
jgi:pilus assembly protein CpaE